VSQGLSGLLLACNGALRALAGTSVGLRALSVNGQSLTVTNALVAADLHLAANVSGDLATEVTLYLEVQLDVVAQRDELIIGEILYADLAADCSVGEGFEGPRAANTVDVSQCDLYALVARDVDAGYVPWWLLLLLSGGNGQHRCQGLQPWVSPASFDAASWCCSSVFS